MACNSPFDHFWSYIFYDSNRKKINLLLLQPTNLNYEQPRPFNKISQTANLFMASTTFAICLIDRLNAASRWKLFGRSGGGRIIFSLSPRRSFFIFWRILCQFSMQINSKNFFLAQNFSTREVFYPGKRLAKCALPSRQCVCVRECGYAWVEVTRQCQKFCKNYWLCKNISTNAATNFFLVQMEWVGEGDGGNLRSLNQSKNSVEEKKLPSFWNGLARTFWMKKCLCSGFITGGGLSGEDLNSLSSNPTDNFVKCLSIIVFIPLNLS